MNLTNQQRLSMAKIDKTSVEMLSLMRTSSNSNHLQLKLHELLGNFKSSVVGCGCIRPASCTFCRTEVEQELYYLEWRDHMMDDILDQARNEYDDQ